MSVTILSTAFLFGYFLSCYGWGRTAVRALGVAEASTVACSAAIGIAIWIFLGGLANLFEIAMPPTLWAIYGFGFLLAIPSVVSNIRWKGAAPSNGRRDVRALFADRFRVLVIFLVVVVLIFLCATLLPSTGFNPHDDFHAYMVRPVRMLDTGSMFGNTFDSLGLADLGAQTFLLGFILIAFPLDHLNGFDMILCLGLSLILLIDIGRRLEVGWPYIGAAILAFLSIHPQNVNISALYSGSLMVLTLVYLMFVLSEKYSKHPPETIWREAMLIAAPLSALLAIKNSFVVFAAIFLAVFFILLMFSHPRRYRAVLAALVTAGSTILLLLPWLLNNLPIYMLMLRQMWANAVYAPPPQPGHVEPAFDVTLLFSPHSSFWGGSFLVYSLVVILIFGAGTLGLLLLCKTGPGRAASIMPMVAGSTAVTASYFALPLLKDPYDAVRFATPLLIAFWPVVGLILVGQSSPLGAPAIRGNAWTLRPKFVGRTVVILQIIVLIPFLGVLSDRVGQAVRYRTMTSFPVGEEFIENNTRSVGESGRSLVRSVQERTRPGATILAWIGAPFHLDFARNRVFSLSAWGMANLWIDFPFEADIQRVHEYLSARRIRYLIWEHDYWARVDDSLLERYAHSAEKYRRAFGQRNLALNRLLPALVDSRLKIYDDGHIVVVDLRAPPLAVGEENTVEPSPDASE